MSRTVKIQLNRAAVMGKGVPKEPMSLREIIMMMAEPALLVQKGEIRAANESALRLFGGEITGKKAQELLDAETLRYSSRSYLAGTTIAGEEYVLRVRRVEEGRLVLLQRQVPELSLLSDAFLYSLRSGLMNFGIAADRMRTVLEQNRELGLTGNMALLTANYYKLMRMTENAALVKNALEKKAVVVPKNLDLSLLTHSVLDAVEEAFPESVLVRSVDSGVHTAVDARLFKLLLLNLLSNCLLHAGADTIRVSLTELPDCVLLGVTDDGKGIPEGKLAGAFERYRGGFSLGEMISGAGLGLAAARSVTALHDGTLLLASAEGEGTAVRASLSKRARACHLGSGEELCSMRDIQVGLADCLPARYYEQEYLD